MNQPRPTLFPEQAEINKRRFPRYSVAIPVDVVVLRSGIPATIPGRSLDVSAGGVAAVLSGELRSGEWVGVSFQLPTVKEPVQAKAMVRHHGPLRCGLQFYAMPSEQQGALSTWIRMAGETAAPLGSTVPTRQESTPRKSQERTRSAPPHHVSRKPHRSSASRRWLWLIPAIGLVLALLFGFWWWHNGGTGLEKNETESSAPSSQPQAKVPGNVMEQRLLHKVDPSYPPEAEKSRLQGLVTLQVVIGPDGIVKDLRPVSGPEVLARAAVDAVKWWRFQPYEVEGKPATVETTIEVEFRL
jgi:TonB family protein